MSLLIALLAALVPTLGYTLLIWWLDRHEKEPLHLLIVAFVWGALPAVALALITEVALAPTVATYFGPGAPTTLAAPIVEETIKALVLIGIFLFARREFNGVLDGIIYGALVGFGFAMTENLLYFLSYAEQFGTVWLMRTLLFGFNHAFFSSIVGIALGLVRYERRRWVGYLATPIALWLAILVHALHNSSAQAGVLGLLLAWLADSGGVLIVLATAVLAQRHELHWTSTYLGAEVERGIIDEEQYQIVQHPAQRLRLEGQALLQGGWTALRATHRFYHLLIELAFVKHQVALGDRFCTPADVEALRVAVLEARRHMEQSGARVAAR